MKFDLDNVLGSVGLFIITFLPTMESISETLRVIGALGGVVLLYYSITHKRLLIKKLKKDGTDKSNGSDKDGSTGDSDSSPDRDSGL